MRYRPQSFISPSRLLTRSDRKTGAVTYREVYLLVDEASDLKPSGSSLGGGSRLALCGSETSWPWNGGMISGWMKLCQLWWNMSAWMPLNQAGISWRLQTTGTALKRDACCAQMVQSPSGEVKHCRQINLFVVTSFTLRVMTSYACFVDGWACAFRKVDLLWKHQYGNTIVVTFGMLLGEASVVMSQPLWFLLNMPVVPGYLLSGL